MSTVFQETIRYAVVSARALATDIAVLVFGILRHAAFLFRPTPRGLSDICHAFQR
jgi:hypothetical protein